MWFVGGWYVSLMFESINIISRAEVQERERKWRRTRKLVLETHFRWAWECGVIVRRESGMEARRP